MKYYLGSFITYMENVNEFIKILKISGIVFMYFKRIYKIDLNNLC